MADRATGPDVSVTGPNLAQERAAPRVLVGMAVAQAGLYVGLLAPVTVSLALKTQSLVGPEQAATVNGNVLAVAALVAMVANPLCGRLSDLTMSRYGRRRPWLIGGAIGFVLASAVIAGASSVPVLLAGWCAAQLAGNAIVAALVATVADQVPARQRAGVSANLGVMQSVGILAAAYVARWFVDAMFLLFLMPALVLLASVAWYVIVLPDRPQEVRPDFEGWAALLRTFWVNPRQHPDFAWAWISRFLFVLANFLFVVFRLFYLQHEIQLTPAEAVRTLGTGVLIYTVALMIAAKVGGWISDRTGRRKMFVFGATLAFALGLVLLGHADSITSFFLVEAVIGAAYGLYAAVDTALVIEVLPRRTDSAKDLGVINIANALPQSIAGAVGGALLTLGGGEYEVLFWCAGGIAVLAAMTILPIRSVR